MKLTLSLLISFYLTSFLTASEEFPLIKPYAVEDAPLIIDVKPKVIEPKAIVEPVVIKEEVIEEPVAQEKTNSVQTVVLDDDNDGVNNDQDRCPDTSIDFMVDGYGCPQTMVLNIQFPSGKAKITNDIILSVKEFAQFLKDNPGYQVIIYGHTDNTGSPEGNKKLSKERANVVKDALVRYDIDEIRLTAIGKGDLEPIADNNTLEGRAQNRRIEIELIQ